MCPLIFLLKLRVSWEKKIILIMSLSYNKYFSIFFFPFLFQNSEILSRKSSASSTGSLDRNNEKLKNSCSGGRNNTPQKIANSVKARIAMYVLITCFSRILKFLCVIVFRMNEMSFDTLSETQYDWRKIEPVTMKANFIHFWCVESEFIVKN